MFSAKKSVRLDKDLYARLQEKSSAAGYSSTDEYIVHVLETAVSGGDGDETMDRDQVDRQLRGLGYLE